MTIAILQELISPSPSSGGSFGLAFSSNLTAGSSLHCLVKTLTSTTITVADNLNGGWTAPGAVLTDGAAHKAQQFVFSGSASGAATVTATLTPAGSSAFMVIREIGGSNGYDTFVEQVQGALSNSTTPNSITTGTQTPGAQPGLLSVIIYSGGPSLPSAGTGFTTGLGPTNNLFSEHLRYTALSAIAGTATGNNNAGTAFINFAAFFKESGAGGLQGVPFMNYSFQPMVAQ